MYPYQEKVIKAGSLIRNALPFIIALFLYALLYSRYFINDDGLIGSDYSYFLPNMLSGYYWYLENGMFEIPWFTPGLCGGLPLLPNPQSIYYSIPQFLLIWFEPLHSVYVTFLSFATAGMITFYLLLVRVFKFSKATALLGSFIFLFNGFYSSRMIMGHLTYHVFMLVPVIAYFLMRHPYQGNQYNNILTGIILPAVLLSYVIHAGALNFVVPLLIMLIGIYYCFRLISGDKTSFWYRFILSGLLALCISASKLVPAFFYVRQFPRDIYSLPGFEGVVSALINVTKSLAGIFDSKIAEQLVNISFPVSNLGFDFSIGFAPLFNLFIYIIYKIVLRVKTIAGKTANISSYQSAIWPIAFIIFIPVLLNTYYPAWNDVLKNLPYIKNSSLLTRWIAIDIPLVIILACHIVDKLKHNKRFYFIIFIVVGVVFVEKSFNSNQYKEEMNYSSSKINAAYLQARQTRHAIPVEKIGAYIDERNQYIIAHARNDELVAGIY